LAYHPATELAWKILAVWSLILSSRVGLRGSGSTLLNWTEIHGQVDQTSSDLAPGAEGGLLQRTKKKPRRSGAKGGMQRAHGGGSALAVAPRERRRASLALTVEEFNPTINL
jgi:hypothetical protein